MICIQRTEYFLFHCKSARCFIILLFLIRLIRWVSLKLREFIYLKFHQIYNSTTQQISSVGGSSISILSIEFDPSFDQYYYDQYDGVAFNGPKKPLHCIGAR
jgi:hypothetical protein